MHTDGPIILQKYSENLFCVTLFRQTDGFLSYVTLFPAKVFIDKQVRMEWDEDEQDWYLSIVDVIDVLTEQATHDGARKYRSVMKTRSKKEGNELTTVCCQLKKIAADGKFYNTDVADTKGILCIIQSIPSPKAEPFKLRLAHPYYIGSHC